MADDPENHTLRLLQELRSDLRAMRDDMHAMRDDLTTQIGDLTTRVDGNTLILNMVAGIVHDHEQRIEAREG